MPRTPDADLKDRILDSAFALWHSNGQKSLTLRAVAKAAGTTTPTVYKRFRDKDALVIAIANRVRNRIADRMRACETLEEAARVYLEQAEANPHEYQVAYGPYWTQLYSGREHQPGLLWAEKKFAERFGGMPEEYSVIVQGLWMMLHGTASLLSVQPHGAVADRLRANCLAACDRVVRSATFFRNT